MDQSMMPKGVEHCILIRFRLLQRRMDQSMMPKGVEHRIPYVADALLVVMDQSMMPKGVEHLNALDTTTIHDTWINL